MLTESIMEMIETQYAANMQKNFFYKPENGIISLEPAKETIESILYKKDELAEFLYRSLETDNFNALSKYMTDRTCAIFIDINQFLDFDNMKMNGLKEIYREFMEDILILCRKNSPTAEDVSEIFKKHTLRLTDYLHETNGIEIFERYRREKLLQEVVCRNYSDAFQTALLDLKFENIMEPVLDLGCGERAELINYLRKAGIRAEGIDRVKGKREDYFASNWFDVVLEPESWGTIISHMAFSNHFWHHHLRSDGEMQRYSLKYHEILRSLKPGGLFIYAPGLPFIEKDLNIKDYSIQKKQIEGIFDPDGRFYVSIIKKELPEKKFDI